MPHGRERCSVISGITKCRSLWNKYERSAQLSMRHTGWASNDLML